MTWQVPDSGWGGAAADDARPRRRPGGTPGPVPGWRSTKLPCMADHRGKLVFMEGERHVPFPIARFFLLYHTTPESRRGNHAHRRCEQFVICLAGAFTIELDDGRNRCRHTLSDPTEGFYVPPLTWLTLKEFAANSVCGVFASAPYDEADYIRDRREFLASIERNIR
jgi:WxcM-like, C-terminal